MQKILREHSYSWEMRDQSTQMSAELPGWLLCKCFSHDTVKLRENTHYLGLAEQMGLTRHLSECPRAYLHAFQVGFNFGHQTHQPRQQLFGLTGFNKLLIKRAQISQQQYTGGLFESRLNEAQQPVALGKQGGLEKRVSRNNELNQVLQVLIFNSLDENLFTLDSLVLNWFEKLQSHFDIPIEPDCFLDIFDLGFPASIPKILFLLLAGWLMGPLLTPVKGEPRLRICLLCFRNFTPQWLLEHGVLAY